MRAIDLVEDPQQVATVGREVDVGGIGAIAVSDVNLNAVDGAGEATNQLTGDRIVVGDFEIVAVCTT